MPTDKCCGMPTPCAWGFVGAGAMLGLRGFWSALTTPDEDTLYAIEMTKRLEKKQFEDQLSYISGVTRRCWHACIDGAAEPAGEAANGLASIQADISPGEHVCLEKCMQKVKEFQDQSATVLAQENERIAERNRRQAAAA